jgi:hypothetical protein
MTAQDYTDLVLELNDSLSNNKYLENIGLDFSYRTNYYYDQILFGDFVVFCSENDSRYDHIYDLEIPIKQIVINNFNKYREALNTIEL